MLQNLLNMAKPAISALIKEKCREKLEKGENSIIISVTDLKDLLNTHLGINFLDIHTNKDDCENGETFINLMINEEKLNG